MVIKLVAFILFFWAIPSFSSEQAQLATIKDERLARIMALAKQVEILAPPTAILRVRLFEIQIEGDCVPETHWVCSHEYYLAVSTIDSDPSVAVYSLGRIGLISKTELVKSLPNQQVTIRFETQAFPNAVIERNKALKLGRDTFFISFNEEIATLSR